MHRLAVISVAFIVLACRKPPPPPLTPFEKEVHLESTRCATEYYQDKAKFDVVITSANEDDDFQDTVWIVQDGKPFVLTSKKSAYAFRQGFSGGHQCGSTLAFSLGGTVVAILFSADDRPAPQYLAAVAWDWKARKVLGENLALANVRVPNILPDGEGGFRFRAIKQFSDDVEADPLVEAWLHVRFQDGKFVTAWEREISPGSLD